MNREIIIGDHEEFLFELTDENGQPVDLTGKIIKVAFTSRKGEDPILHIDAEITGAPEGQAVFNLSHQDSGQFTPGVWLFEVKVYREDMSYIKSFQYEVKFISSLYKL